MKPTSATKDNVLTLAAKNHELYGSELSQRLLISAQATINERERLREIAKDALRFREEVNGKCDHDEAMTKLCTQCEIRAVLGEQKGEG